LVAGFGGLRHLDDGGLAFAPRLPGALSKITFRLRWRGRRVRVQITPEQAEYRLLEGTELELSHYGQRIMVTANSPQVLPIPPTQPTDQVMQPVGREPLARRLREAGS
jgi:alpha,alpha-trehalose phosphorylase